MIEKLEELEKERALQQLVNQMTEQVAAEAGQAAFNKFKAFQQQQFKLFQEETEVTLAKQSRHSDAIELQATLETTIT